MMDAVHELKDKPSKQFDIIESAAFCLAIFFVLLTTSVALVLIVMMMVLAYVQMICYPYWSFFGGIIAFFIICGRTCLFP